MIKAPPSIRREHEQLHAGLDKACALPGRVGEAARQVARIMHPHFRREDEYAAPPLRLLPDLAAGRMRPDMKAVIPLVDRLKEELPLMLQEHRAIQAALLELERVAGVEGLAEQARFAEALRLHVEAEEEVFYPATILVGEYLKLKLRKG